MQKNCRKLIKKGKIIFIKTKNLYKINEIFIGVNKLNDAISSTIEELILRIINSI